MAAYKNLELDHYYLIREEEGGEIALVQPVMETEKCFLILDIDEIETTHWKKKEDAIFEIVEELTEEQVEEYEAIFDEDDEEWGLEETEYGFDDEDSEDAIEDGRGEK